MSSPFLTASFLFLTITLHGQSSADLILTKEQNEKWFETIKKQSLHKQIDFLNERLLTDTSIFVPTKFELLEKVQLNGKQVGFCKPILVISGIQISIENRTSSDNIQYLTSLLTKRTVNKIEIIKGDQATAFLGSRGTCNGIIVSIKGRRTKKKLKKLADNMYPAIKEIRWRH